MAQLLFSQRNKATKKDGVIGVSVDVCGGLRMGGEVGQNLKIR